MPDNEVAVKITGDASSLKDATDAAKEHLKHAGESVDMLGDLIGVKVPGAIKDMLASSDLIAPALEAAFAPLAVISLGVAIFDATEKAKQHREELQKLADEALGDADSIGKFGEQVRISNLRLEDQIRVIQKKPAQNGIKIALAEAAQQADQLTASIEKAIAADNKLLQSQAQGTLSRIFFGSGEDQKLKNEIADKYAEFQEELKRLDQQTTRDELDNTKEVANDRKNYNDKLAELAEYLKTAQGKIDAARNERAKTLEHGPQANGDDTILPAVGKDEATAEATNEFRALQEVITTLRTTLAGASTAAKELKQNLNLKIKTEEVVVPLDDVLHRKNKILAVQQLENKAAGDEVTTEQALILANLTNLKAVQQQAEFGQKNAENSAKIAQLGRDIQDKQAERNAALAVALGYTTQGKADAQALATVEKDKTTAVAEANNRLTAQQAIVKQLGIDTMYGMLGSPEQKAAYQKAALDFQKLKIEELNIEKKYDDQIAALRLKLANTSSSQLRRQLLEWRDVNKQLTQSFMQMINGFNSSLAAFVVTGTVNWKQLAANAIQSIIQIELQYEESKHAAAIQDAIHAALQKVLNAGRAHSSAATAAAGTLADVPYPMNIPASAEVLGVGEGYAVGAMSSAGGDWRVDNDRLNFVHKDETILPAGIAGKLRSMVEGGASSGGGVTVVVNHSVSAVDAASFQGHIRRHGNMIANEVTRALKRKGVR